MKPGGTEVLGDWLDAHAAHYPKRAAITFEGLTIDFSDLQRQVDQCARRYLAHGVRQGDCVAMLSTSRPEAFISFLAAARIGALWLGLNPRYQMPELSYVVVDAQPKLLIFIDTLDGRAYAKDVAELARANSCIQATVMIERGEQGASSFYSWIASGTEQPGGTTLDDARRAVDDSCPAFLVYTSGSSGKPKGVMLRHRELIRRSKTQNERFPAEIYPQVLNPLPINHIAGMHFIGLFAFIGGGTIHYSERFSALEFVQALQSGKVNILIVLPTMFKLMVEQPGFSAGLLAPLDWFIYSGAAMAPDLLEMIQSSGCPIGVTYGMTETSGSVTYSDADATIEVLTNTIGRPVPDGEARVADAAGVPCAPDVPGELQIRAQYCMAGYFGRDQATRDAYTADGWLRTGDLASVRPDGNIRFIGRASEMFKSGGYNVYPREIELALETLDAVVLSAVVCVPDPLFDEVGWAYVVPSPGREISETDLAAWCKSQLANYKVPKRFIICSELPLLPVGKVDKVKLKAQAMSELG